MRLEKNEKKRIRKHDSDQKKIKEKNQFYQIVSKFNHFKHEARIKIKGTALEKKKKF